MIRFYPTSLNVNGQIDGYVDYIFAEMQHRDPQRFQRVGLDGCDVIFFSHTYRHDYKFDVALARRITELDKPIIMFDYVEPGSKAFHSIYVGVRGEGHYGNKEYLHLFAWYNNMLSRTRLYFKRELLINDDIADFPFPVRPIEYLVRADSPKGSVATFEEFTGRLIDFFLVWGYSNWSRPILHGELLKYAANRPSNLLIMDHRHIFRDKSPGKIVLLYMPHYDRIPLVQMLKTQNNAKISITMNGCGQKCYRHAESCNNSVMALQDTNLIWTYPWVDGQNCIVLPVTGPERKVDEVRAVHILKEYLGNAERLYEIYCQCQKTFRLYCMENYLPNYVNVEVTNALEQDLSRS